MAAQAQVEGRFLGGRPPYGYLIVDAGPHPNPSKAADGKRLHKLDIDPEAMPVVFASSPNSAPAAAFTPSPKG